jgi:hypothetical protein
MGFRDEKQRATVCHILMKLVRMEKLFLLPTDLGGGCGPTGNAEQEWSRIREGRSIISSGEQTMLLLAWYFWNGHGEVRIGDIMSLESTVVRAIGTLIHAYSSKGQPTIDEWIEVWMQVDPAAEYFAS